RRWVPAPSNALGIDRQLFSAHRAEGESLSPINNVHRIPIGRASSSRETPVRRFSFDAAPADVQCTLWCPPGLIDPWRTRHTRLANEAREFRTGSLEPFGRGTFHLHHD